MLLTCVNFLAMSYFKYRALFWNLCLVTGLYTFFCRYVNRQTVLWQVELCYAIWMCLWIHAKTSMDTPAIVFWEIFSLPTSSHTPHSVERWVPQMLPSYERYVVFSNYETCNYAVPNEHVTDFYEYSCSPLSVASSRLIYTDKFPYPTPWWIVAKPLSYDR